jgi:hypothetical protein
MKAKSLIIILSYLIIVSCESAYKYSVVNDIDKPVVLRINPSILHYVHGSYKEKLIEKNKSSVDSVFICELDPKDTVNLYADIGRVPKERDLPYSYVEILIGNDTIRLNRGEIIDALAIIQERTYTTEYSIMISTLTK